MAEGPLWKLAMIAACLLILPAGHQASFGAAGDSLTPLQILQIRVYRYDSNGAGDHHFGEQRLASAIPGGTEIVLNGVVSNQNHPGEHFDYITQVLDSNGYTKYAHVRQGVAVPAGGQVGIDSGPPIVLDEAGTFAIEVFAWKNMDGSPVSLTDKATGSIKVIEN